MHYPIARWRGAQHIIMHDDLIENAFCGALGCLFGVPWLK
jgi:hypothetical protein